MLFVSAGITFRVIYLVNMREMSVWVRYGAFFATVFDLVLFPSFLFCHFILLGEFQPFRFCKQTEDHPRSNHQLMIFIILNKKIQND